VLVIPQFRESKAADSARVMLETPSSIHSFVRNVFLYFFLESLQSSAAHSVTDSVWAELSAIAADAVNVIIGTVVQIGRVQRVMAIVAVETAFVPHLCNNFKNESKYLIFK
jgi:hypothetical protein